MARQLDVQTDQRQILERMLTAFEKTQERLLRATRLLEGAGVRYAVVGGNAVAVWVATRDESLVRATRDVDLLITRADFERVQAALESGGFEYRRVAGIDMFLDGPERKAGDAVHIVYAGEKVREEHPTSAPEIIESEDGPEFRVAKLEALVRMKLAAWRDKDRVHLRDLLGAGVLDETWSSRFDEPLRSRLESLLLEE